MISVIFAAVGVGYGLIAWLALRLPFDAVKELRVPSSAVRFFILMMLVAAGVPAIAHRDTGAVFAAGAASSFALALVWDLVIRLRRHRARQRTPLSDEVVDRQYGKSVRASAAANELLRSLFPQTLIAVVVAALCLAIAAVLPQVTDLVLGAPTGAGAEPTWIGGAVQVACLSLPVLMVGFHLVGPLVLALARSWHLAGLTDNERHGAEQRAMLIQVHDRVVKTAR